VLLHWSKGDWHVGFQTTSSVIRLKTKGSSGATRVSNRNPRRYFDRRADSRADDENVQPSSAPGEKTKAPLSAVLKPLFTLRKLTTRYLSLRSTGFPARRERNLLQKGLSVMSFLRKITRLYQQVDFQMALPDKTVGFTPMSIRYEVCKPNWWLPTESANMTVSLQG
jgi:hypothetical protein